MKMTAVAVLLAGIAFGVVDAAAQDGQAGQGGATGQDGMRGHGGMMGQGGQGGMMGQGQGRLPDLKELSAEQSVKSVRYCDGKYFVTNGAGDVLPFRDFDLRFKTDAGDQGPRRGAPALLPAGMMGDRAFLIFSDPGEISGYVEKECRDR